MIHRNEVATKLLRGQIRALVIVMSQQGFFRGGDAESAAEFTLGKTPRVLSGKY